MALADTSEGCVGSVTLTVASPAPTAVTTPSGLTVATASLEEDHTTSVTLASAGSWEALSVTLWPTDSVADSGETDSFVMGMAVRSTFTLALLTGQSHTCR